LPGGFDPRLGASFHLTSYSGDRTGKNYGFVDAVDRRAHRRLDLLQKAGEVSQFGIVDGALDRAAGGVPHHQDHLRAGQLASELHAAEDVVVGDIAGDAAVEDVADAEIHDRLGRRS
jgi:hypothetical protein